MLVAMTYIGAIGLVTSQTILVRTIHRNKCTAAYELARGMTTLQVGAIIFVEKP